MTYDPFHRYYSDLHTNDDVNTDPEDIQRIVDRHFRENPITRTVNIGIEIDGVHHDTGTVDIPIRLHTDTVIGFDEVHIRDREISERPWRTATGIGLDNGRLIQEGVPMREIHGVPTLDPEQARAFSEHVNTQISNMATELIQQRRQNDGDARGTSFRPSGAVINPRRIVEVEESTIPQLRAHMRILENTLRSKGILAFYTLLGYTSQNDNRNFIRCPLCQHDKMYYNRESKRKSNHIPQHHPAGRQRFWEAAASSTKITHITETCRCGNCDVILSESQGVSKNHMRPTPLGQEILQGHYNAALYILTTHAFATKVTFKDFFREHWYQREDGSIAGFNRGYTGYGIYGPKSKIDDTKYVLSLFDYAYQHVPKQASLIPTNSL